MHKQSTVETCTLTELRANIYQLFNQVEETGKPIYIRRNGKLYQVAIFKETIPPNIR